MSMFTGKPADLLRNGVLIAVKLSPPAARASISLFAEQQSVPPIDTVAAVNTSAMYTYIQEGVATSLGLKPIEPVKITTATRLTYESYMYRIRLLFSDGGAVEVNAVEVPYMMHPLTRIKCLIGRDILQLCVLTYDGRTNTVTLDLQLGR
jgi:hypothetical protein